MGVGPRRRPVRRAKTDDELLPPHVSTVSERCQADAPGRRCRCAASTSTRWASTTRLTRTFRPRSPVTADDWKQMASLGFDPYGRSKCRVTPRTRARDVRRGVRGPRIREAIDQARRPPDLWRRPRHAPVTRGAWRPPRRRERSAGAVPRVPAIGWMARLRGLDHRSRRGHRAANSATSGGRASFKPALQSSLRQPRRHSHRPHRHVGAARSRKLAAWTSSAVAGFDLLNASRTGGGPRSPTPKYTGVHHRNDHRHPRAAETEGGGPPT